MQSYVAYIGGVAALLTSLSYVPQIRKAWPRRSTQDLSLKMLIALTGGLALWIVYGLLLGDWVIVAANGVGGTLTFFVLACKLRDMRMGGEAAVPGDELTAVRHRARSSNGRRSF